MNNKVFRRLVSYILDYKIRVISIFIMAGLAGLFSVLGPRILGLAITSIANSLYEGVKNKNHIIINYKYLIYVLGILAVIYVLSSVFSYCQKALMVGVAQKAIKKLRNEVDEKLDKLPLNYFDKKTKGDILSRIINDLNLIATTLQQTLNQMIRAVVTLVAVVIMMFSINVWLAIACMIVLPCGILITKPMMKRSKKFFRDQQKELGNINGHIEEFYTYHKEIKSFNMETEVLEKFNEINDNYYKAGWKSQFISGLIMPVTNFINNLGYIVVSVLGGYFIYNGSLTIGNMQAFLRYIRIFTEPINQVANIMNVIQSTIAAGERVFEILDENEIQDVIKSEVEFSGNISFRNVSFSYGDKKVINDLSLEVKAGETIAIVGATGSGKTTLINLLMKFYDITSGDILFDDVSIKKINSEILRENIGMVLQNTWLFNGSIKENISFSKIEVENKEIVEAAKLANADHFIKTFIEGYETKINEEGSNISQGQKQLLTIARVLLRNSKIMILDEATSNVDTRTEVLIQQAMQEVMKGKTSFVIAHRLSTIYGADKIIVMDNGKIVEFGNHNDLIEKQGRYYELLKSQY